MVYAEHGVRGRVELARKLGREMPAAWETKLEKIRRRLLAGWTYEQVAAEVGTTRHDIAHYAAVLRRKGIAVAYQGRPSPPRDERRHCRLAGGRAIASSAS
jgi:hypothetical protein